MKKLHITIAILGLFNLNSCTTFLNKDYPLVFMDKSNLGAGIEMNPSTSTYTTNLGLNSRSFALVPVSSVNKDGTRADHRNEGEAMSVYTEFGGKQSFLANLLGLDGSKANDKASGGLNFQRIFATGKAAISAADRRGLAAALDSVSDEPDSTTKDKIIDKLPETSEQTQ